MIRFSLERINSRNIRQRWFRQDPDSSNQPPARILPLMLVHQPPNSLLLIKFRTLYPCRELHIRSEVMLVHNMIDVSQSFLLSREVFLPMPFVHQVFVEEVLI